RRQRVGLIAVGHPSDEEPGLPLEALAEQANDIFGEERRVGAALGGDREAGAGEDRPCLLGTRRGHERRPLGRPRDLFGEVGGEAGAGRPDPRHNRLVTELFYTIADADCAAARRAVLERNLKERVSFRNLDYPEVAADFSARGGRTAPALWDGERLHQGLLAVTAVLDRMRAAPAPP